MTDNEAKALLNILAADRLPVVSTARRQAVILHALRAIEDRTNMMQMFDEPPGDDVEREAQWRALAAARHHMRGES